ncbi:uncharacterized protein C8Q71DRAFT_782530 [Rhodofomes roseus]|uniref:Uncharacterized protein n=1 Tax=Rhodofomes roseus TaxID=34475 RepID=A0ABQ8K3K0_9APHY|nr:uncharacterized protein C8Q71DRAFT_782530 [Rhodofomes roseus]KAH9831428.1 hypothetical protein C8Q71DRAFT_782530 [Rhodofomes roseus]
MPPRTNTTSTAAAEHTTPTVEHLIPFNNGPDESHADVGAIVGGVIGGVVVFVLLVVLGWYFWRRRKQRAPWHYAMSGEFDAADDMKPYIITPYITPDAVSFSRPDRSLSPPSRALSPESDLNVTTLTYDAVPPEFAGQANDLDSWTEIAVYRAEERGRTPSLIANRVTSPTPSLVAQERVTSPTPFSAGSRIIVTSPTHGGAERPASRAGSLMAARAGLVSATAAIAEAAEGLKEKAKKKRKSKIQSVPRPLSFCIDRSKPGSSPLDQASPQFSAVPLSAMSATFTQ